MQETPDVDVCSGDTIPYINFVSTPMASEYQWTNDYPDIGIPASGSGNIGPGIIGGINGSDTDCLCRSNSYTIPRWVSRTSRFIFNQPLS